MLISKRHLTQSEKHRRYVDGGRQPTQNTASIRETAFRFTECPQNLAQSRKLVNTFEEIEKQKSKSVAKINGEKHLLQLKYKGLIKNEDCNPEIAETFFLQPGFRFRRNGEVRKIRNPRVMPDVELNSSCRSLLSLAKSNSSNQSVGSQSSNNQGQKSVSHKSSSSTGEGDCPVKKESDVNIEKTIKEIEKDLKRIKTDKELICINRRIRDVRRSLTFVRAHANDYKPDVPYIVQDYHQNMFSSVHGSVQSQRQSSKNIIRLSKHYTKINCPACENRLKHDNEKMSSPQESPDKHMQRWQFAPRGVYVSRLESKESNCSKSRPASSAKTMSESQETKDSQTASCERRASKSASSTSQKNKYTQRGTAAKVPKRKPHTLLDRFKARENANIVPQQTQSENKVVDEASESSLIQHSHQCPMSAPEIVKAEGDYKGEAKTVKSDSDGAVTSHSSQEELVKDDINSKVTAFCNTLPDVKPLITTWRKSSGQLVTWKPSDKLRGTKSSQECTMTWGEYQQSKRDVSLDHELQFKFYQSSQEKPSGDPNSYEELAKCRYLREFKMKSNLPEK